MLVNELKVCAIQFFAGIENTYCTMLGSDNYQHVFEVAKNSDILSLVENFWIAINTATPASEIPFKEFEQFSCGWGAQVLPPFTELLRYDILVIITDGYLHNRAYAQ